MGIIAVKPMVNDLVRGLDSRRNVRRWFNSIGIQAEAMAKAAAPVRTGALRASISWVMIGSDLSRGGVLQGRLRVGVVYGRRQEWEHATKSFYAYRAIRAASDEVEKTLQGDAASVWLTGERGYRGSWSWNPAFGPNAEGPFGSAGSVRIHKGLGIMPGQGTGYHPALVNEPGTHWKWFPG